MKAMHCRLRLAEKCVPPFQRASWRQEWVAELSVHLQNDPQTALQCCDGLLADALTLRWLHLVKCWRAIDWRSPQPCMRVLLGVFTTLLAISLAQEKVRHLVFSRWGAGAFVSFVILAVFTLPSTIVTSRYGARDAYEGKAAAMNQRFVRWKFLIGKILLLVLTCFLMAVQVTRPFQHLLGEQADWLLIACGLFFNVVAISWALNDQRERCPTCMRLLRHPARLGPPSWGLLDSCATEEMCDRGHGLLHQPEWQTSWFENARWLQLDSTWRELFHP